jgi:hypothetical protein
MTGKDWFLLKKRQWIRASYRLGEAYFVNWLVAQLARACYEFSAEKRVVGTTDTVVIPAEAGIHGASTKLAL